MPAGPAEADPRRRLVSAAGRNDGLDRRQGLVDIKKVLVDLDLPFVLEGGVLLGAVREGDFIAWDVDVGVALRTEDMFHRQEQVVEALGAAGFDLHSTDPRHANFKINVVKYGTRYELLGWYRKGRMRRRDHYRMPAAFLEETEDLTFLGEVYRCPSPPERYLRYFYGNWRKPKSSGRFFTIRCHDQRAFWGRQLRKAGALFGKLAWKKR